MRKFLIGAVIFLCFGVLVSDVWAQNTPPVSTQGLTFQEGVEKSVKPTQGEMQEYRLKNKMKKKYFKNISIIKNKKYKKSIQERDLEFYKNRLEINKHELEEVNSNGSKKGEN